MRTILDGFGELVRLIGDTFRLWWRNLLPLTTWFLAGYAGFRAAVFAAIWLGQHQHRSLAVGVFSAGVLIQIAASVGMIRTCAGSLYRWRDAAADQAEETTDPTRRGLLDLLSVTLLPLVAVWSAWGFLEERITELSVSNSVALGLGPGSTLIEVADGAWKGYLPAIVVLLVVRRVVEAIDDRWPSRPAKFLQVWAEAFFVLLTVIVIPRAVSEARDWLGQRTFWFVATQGWEQVREFFAVLRLPVPDAIEFWWDLLWGTLWPLFADGVGEPLTWLAITTVVFGHKVLSSGGVFRGTRLERRFGPPDAGSEAPTPGRLVRLTNQAPNLVLGGLREKFYPTLNAFRLLVRVGPVFLGVVCVGYTLWLLGSDWTFYGLQRLIGVHGEHWGVMNAEIADAVGNLVFEPLRIALLAAAFDLCIAVGTQRRTGTAGLPGPADRAGSLRR